MAFPTKKTTASRGEGLKPLPKEVLRAAELMIKHVGMEAKNLDNYDYEFLSSLIIFIREKYGKTSYAEASELEYDCANLLHYVNEIYRKSLERRLEKTISELRKIRDPEFV